MMQRRPGHFNRKRKLDPTFTVPEAEALAAKLRYGGNPEHKRNPGDFGLIPPAMPRPDKELCDDLAMFTRERALDLLRRGALLHLVSHQKVHGLPQNIWSADDEGRLLEAQLENWETATYHGYPLARHDPFYAVVLDAWGGRR